MRKTTYPFFLAVIVAVFGALVSVGFVASAQNANSSTTMTNSNTNTRPRRPRRPRPRSSPSPEATADTTATAPTTPQATPRRTGRCDPNQQEQTDLSGTYTGTLRHGSEVRDATLTISGNSITLTSGTETHTGRITAVTTCGYTAVTVMHGDMSTPPPGATPKPPNKAMSLRAKKVGDSLTLMSVPGEPEKVMFTTGGGARRPRRQPARRPATPPATPSPTPPQQ